MARYFRQNSSPVVESARKYADQTLRIAHMFGTGETRKLGAYGTLEGNQELTFKGGLGIRLDNLEFMQGFLKKLVANATVRRQKQYGSPYRGFAATPEDPQNQGSNACIDFDLKDAPAGTIVLGGHDLAGFIVRITADALLSLSLGTVDVIPTASTTEVAPAAAVTAVGAWEAEEIVAAPVTRRARRNAVKSEEEVPALPF